MEHIKLLDEKLHMRDLDYLPLVWGRGYEKFAKGFTNIRSLPIPDPVLGEGKITWAFSPTPPLNGLKTGLLVLDVLAPENLELQMTVRWTLGDSGYEDNWLRFKTREGTLIVPMDSSPRWLLNPMINEFELELKKIPPTREALERKWQEAKLSAIPLRDPISTRNLKEGQPDSFTAINTDPQLVYTLPDKVINQALIVRMVVDAPTGNNMAQVFFWKSSQGYTQGHSMRGPAQKGLNELFFLVPADMGLNILRIDPGNAKGKYVIHSLEIKPMSSRPIQQVTITRAEVMQRHRIKELGLDELAYSR